MKTILMFVAAAGMVTFASCGGGQKSGAQSEAQDSVATEAVAQNETVDGVIVVTNDVLEPVQGKVMFVDFNATWCGPCRMYAPVYHEVAKRYEGKAEFYSVDTDKNPAVAQKYVGQYIPQTTAIAADGQVFSKTGQLSDEELTAFVDSVLAIPAK